MTWIALAPTMLGYSIAVSDIRVRLESGAEHDCLQKIHPVSSNMLLAFSGSVELGFAMVERARELIQNPASRGLIHPEHFTQQFSRVARRVFSDPSYAAKERDSGCTLAVVGAYPTRRQAVPLMLRSGLRRWPKNPFGSYVYVLRAPKFRAETVQVGTVTSIGSGITAYDGRFAEMWRKKVSLLQLSKEGRSEFRVGRALGEELSFLLSGGHVRGVSRFIQCAYVSSSAMQIEDAVPFVGPARSRHSLINFSFLTPEEREPMPRLVATWHDFNLFAASVGSSASEASAAIALP